MEIMIVDDNTEIRETIKRILSSLNANFYQYDSGENIASEYKKICPDWVLMDIRMPMVDGFQATRIIRDLDPHAKVIIVTNYSDKEFRKEATQLNVEGYVMKENLYELREIVK